MMLSGFFFARLKNMFEWQKLINLRTLLKKVPPVFFQYFYVNCGDVTLFQKCNLANILWHDNFEAKGHMTTIKLKKIMLNVKVVVIAKTKTPP